MRSTGVTILTPESIDRFRNWCIAKGQSSNTAKAYSTDLRMLLLWSGLEAIPLTEDDYEMLAMTWLNQTRAEAAPKTTGRRLTSLRAFARWTGHSELMSEYQAPKPGKSLPHPLPERLEGLERMLEQCRNHEQEALIGLTGFVGLRIGEALATNIKWLDPHERVLRVRGKGDKERFVPVSPRAWSAMSIAYVRAMSGDGKLIHYQDRSARKCITAIGRRAQLSRPVGSHDLRATYATILSEKGVPQRVIQELLGHANGSTTEVYTEVRMSLYREAVEF